MSAGTTAQSYDEFFEAVRAGSNFDFYQDLRLYDEWYCFPDNIVVVPSARKVYWFDVDHLSVERASNGSRCHVPWNLWRKKFAFSATDGAIHVQEGKLFGNTNLGSTARAARASGIRYVVRQRYKSLPIVDSEGRPRHDGLRRLREAWQWLRGAKVSIDIGHSAVIFPVRMAFRSDAMFTFTSKTIVIPHAAGPDFSWDAASRGNICVNSDGSTSIYRQRRNTGLAGTVRAVAFDAGNYICRLLSDFARTRPHAVLKGSIRRMLGKPIESMLPYEIEVGMRPWSLLVPTADAPLLDEYFVD